MFAASIAQGPEEKECGSCRKSPKEGKGSKIDVSDDLRAMSVGRACASRRKLIVDWTLSLGVSRAWGFFMRLAKFCTTNVSRVIGTKADCQGWTIRISGKRTKTS